MRVRCVFCNLWHCSLTKRIVLKMRWTRVSLAIWLCSVGYKQAKQIRSLTSLPRVWQCVSSQSCGQHTMACSLPERNEMAMACLEVSSLSPHVDTKRTRGSYPLHQALVSGWQCEHLKAWGGQMTYLLGFTGPGWQCPLDSCKIRCLWASAVSALFLSVLTWFLWKHALNLLSCVCEWWPWTQRAVNLKLL